MASFRFPKLYSSCFVFAADINYASFYDRLQHPLNMKELLNFRERDPKGYAVWYKWYINHRKRTDSVTTPANSTVGPVPQSAMNSTTVYQPDRRGGSGHASGQSSISGEILGQSKEK